MKPMDATTEPGTGSPLEGRYREGPGRVLAVAPATPWTAARHFLAKLAFETDPSDVAADLRAGRTDLVIVDTRSSEAFAASHLPGAVNLPHATIDEATTAGLDPGAFYVTYCWGPACNASTRGAANLASLGFRVKELIGGLSAWQAEGFPVDGLDGTSRAVFDPTCAC
jgi:rhodanese-related sulfurtransferase